MYTYVWKRNGKEAFFHEIVYVKLHAKHRMLNLCPMYSILGKPWIPCQTTREREIIEG